MSIKLRRNGLNITELEIGDRLFLFSYDTLVAAHDPIKGWFKTKVHYNKTTSRHVNQWLRLNHAYMIQSVEHDVLQNMIEGKV